MIATGRLHVNHGIERTRLTEGPTELACRGPLGRFANRVRQPVSSMLVAGRPVL